MRRAVPYLLLGLLTALVAAAVGIGLQDQPRANEGAHSRGAVEAAIIAITAPLSNPVPTPIPVLPWGAVVPFTDVAPCRSASVQIIPETRGGAGTVVVDLGIENVGNLPCSLKGCPKVFGLNSAGLPVAQTTEEDEGYAWGQYPYSQPPVVVLAAGEAAHTTVFGDDYNDINCPSYPALSVTLPGDDVAKVVSETHYFDGVVSCASIFNVNFIRPML